MLYAAAISLDVFAAIFTYHYAAYADAAIFAGYASATLFAIFITFIDYY